MQPEMSLQRFLAIMERGGMNVEGDRERLTRLYFAMRLSTDEVVANAIESAMLRPERERADA